MKNFASNLFLQIEASGNAPLDQLLCIFEQEVEKMRDAEPRQVLPKLIHKLPAFVDAFGKFLPMRTAEHAFVVGFDLLSKMYFYQNGLDIIISEEQIPGRDRLPQNLTDSRRIIKQAIADLTDFMRATANELKKDDLTRPKAELAYAAYLEALDSIEETLGHNNKLTWFNYTAKRLNNWLCGDTQDQNTGVTPFQTPAFAL